MGEIPQEGELAQLPVPRLLLALRRERYDGALRLTRDRVEKRILFQSGVPVFAESNLPSESLGVQLLDDGRIDRAQHARISGLVQEKGVKEGAALLELEALSPREIFEGLKDQVRRRILSCFAWPDGCYALESHAGLREDAQAFRTDPLPLVFEGLLRHWGTDHLVAQLTIRLDRYPHAARGFARLRKALADDAEAIAFLDSVDGKSSLGTLLESHFGASALAAAWMADAADLVEWREAPPGDEKGVDADAEAAPEIELVFGDGAAEPSAPSAEEEAAPHRNTDARLEALRREVLERHAALRELDHYGVLGIDREADAGAVKRAYLTAAKRFHPDALSGQGLSDVREQATALFARVARAYATLSDSRTRKDYDAELDGHATTDADRIANAEALYRKGEILLKAGDFAGAVPFLKPAVELWPDEPVYRSALGWALFKKTPPDLEGAQDQLEAAVSGGDDNATAHLRLSIVLKEAGDADGATRHAARAKAIDPKATAR